MTTFLRHKLTARSPASSPQTFPPLPFLTLYVAGSEVGALPLPTMMGLCQSCFCRGLHRSPEAPDRASLVAGGEEQKLLRKEGRGSQGSLVTREPRGEASKEEKLEKSETGDSGTCVDEILGHTPATSKEAVEEAGDLEEEEVFEAEDQVQLTVSSLASLGMLEDVPEHAEEEQSELGEEQSTVSGGTRGGLVGGQHNNWWSQSVMRGVNGRVIPWEL